MGRSDVKRLKVPDLILEDAEDKGEDKLTEEVTMPDLVSEVRHKSKEVESAPLKVCPECSANLSSVEAKMGRCLSCGKSLAAAEQDNNPIIEHQKKDSFSVRI